MFNHAKFAHWSAIKYKLSQYEKKIVLFFVKKQRFAILDLTLLPFVIDMDDNRYYRRSIPDLQFSNWV
jgi:hypothetical protein